MVIFHSDIDNTLIYSDRWNFNKPKTCVECINNGSHSYMLNTSMEKLNKLLNREDVLVVPITARNLEQFYRINLPKFKYVLTNNGGILLKDGRLDLDWYIQSLDMAKKCDDLFLLLEKVLKLDVNVYSPITFNNNLFLRVCSNNPEKTIDILKKESGYSNKVLIYNVGQKVYICPAGIDKNYSIKRFKDVIKRDYTVLADDSICNYSEDVDLFLTNDKCCLDYNYNNTVYLDGILSERVLNFVLNL